MTHLIASPASISPAGICPLFPWTPTDIWQPQQELYVQCVTARAELYMAAQKQECYEARTEF